MLSLHNKFNIGRNLLSSRTIHDMVLSGVCRPINNKNTASSIA